MKYIITIILISCTLQLSAQSEKQKEKAENLGREAIGLMDEGNYNKAITLLLKAYKLDPDRFDYPYEIAYALYSSELYREAIDWLKPLQSHPDVSEVLFQLLGNAYDELGAPDSAIYIYQNGLKKFPDSGRLYLESGIVEYRQKNYDNAVGYWENGIRVEPNFSSNYFWLGRTLADSDLKIWSLIYGELFMLLEPGTNRSQEMSKILYDVYNSAIQFTSDTSATISLSKKIIINADEFSKTKKIPFELTFGALLSAASIPNPDRTGKDLTIYTFSEIRESFLKNWDSNKFGSNILFDFHKDMFENNVFTYYNYWLIIMGDPENYSDWYENHGTEFDSFAAYFNDNRPLFTKKNLMVRE